MAVLDEMVDGRGGIRPHWRGVLGVLSSMDPTGLADRATRLARAAEGDGDAPSWRLDPVPFPIAPAEFASLEAGLCQRARLLEAVLADLYGPQSLLADGAVPPALVFANPGFLRACRGSPAPPGRFLQTYAADLVRSPDGQWRVLADRTGGALGIGYAREGRRLLARVLPELFRPTQVRQLRPFFEAWQDALQGAAAPADGRVPFVALLTPGVTDPHWPEHLALSRDLNCALVEARDLTVRAGILHLRTLLGLQPVDVLLRRLPGDAIDPLELHAPGPGVAGLLDAARTGAVRILNHPGAALVEAPALAAILPSLSRRLLGEALRLATVPTVWLGDDGMQHMVCQAFHRWSVRPALDPARPPVPLSSLSAEGRRDLEAAIAARPWSYAACTLVTPSVAPCFAGAGEGLAPRPVVLRLFLMHDGRCWRMMQGGLARVLTEGEHVTEALPPGALFKDVWVASQDRAEIRGPGPVRQPPVAIRRSVGDLPSRVADDFFWLGRYVERLDMHARLARAGLLRSARGAPLPREVAETALLLTCLAQVGMVDDEDGSPLPRAVQLALMPGGASASVLSHAAGLTEALRDRLTPETHAALAHAHRVARTDLEDALRRAGPGQAPGVDGLMHAMTGLQRLATTLAGIASEGMVRGGGRLFLDLGRRIERSYLSTQMLAAVLAQPPARMAGTLQLLLELCDSAITYQGRYLSAVQPAPVLDLVLADPDNPRSLAYQFAQAARLLHQAGCPALAGEAEALLRRAGEVVDLVLRAADPVASAAALPEPLLALGTDITMLSGGITRRFFALLPALQAVGFEVEPA